MFVEPKVTWPILCCSVVNDIGCIGAMNDSCGADVGCCNCTTDVFCCVMGIDNFALLVDWIIDTCELAWLIVFNASTTWLACSCAFADEDVATWLAFWTAAVCVALSAACICPITLIIKLMLGPDLLDCCCCCVLEPVAACDCCVTACTSLSACGILSGAVIVPVVDSCTPPTLTMGVLVATSGTKLVIAVWLTIGSIAGLTKLLKPGQLGLDAGLATHGSIL